MTYNFDPDDWLLRERAVLDLRRSRCEIDDSAYDAACAELDRRYEEMVARLDGTYQIPPGPSDEGGKDREEG